MSRWLAGAVVALVFASGVGVGSLATLAISDLAHRGDRRERPRLLVHERQLARHLDLTADQMDQLRQLRRRAEQHLGELQPRLRTEIESLRDRHLSAVMEVLDDQQRRQLQEMIERRERRHRRKRPSRE